MNGSALSDGGSMSVLGGVAWPPTWAHTRNLSSGRLTSLVRSLAAWLKEHGAYGSGDSVGPLRRSENSAHANVLVAYCFIVLSATLWYGLSLDLGFSADGAFYFASVLDQRDFLSGVWSRQYANVISQWPLVWTVRLGITDLSLLKAVFAGSLYLPLAFSFGLCIFALRGLDKTALLFPLASILLVTFPAAFILTGESHFMTLTTWPILFLILRPRLARADAAVLVALLLVLSRTYETAFASGAVFATLSLVRLRYGPPENRSALLAALAVSVIVIGVGIYWSIFPAHIGNRSSFLHALVKPLYNPIFVCSLAALSFLVLVVRDRAGWAFAASFAFAALSIVLSLVGIVASAGVSFNCRTLTLTILPVMLLAAAHFYACGCRLERNRILVAAVFTLLAIANGMSWQRWASFKEDFQVVLEHSSGYIALEDTSLLQSRYRWGWTSPLLSILWSDGCVRTIVLNPVARVGWVPFDPRNKLPLQRYFSFAQPFRSAAPDSQVCT